MPLVDDDGNVIDINRQWSLQSEVSQQRTLDQLEMYRDILEDELGKFTVKPLWTGRVLVELRDQEPLVAYLTDEQDIDARVVLDDFTPEIWDEWLQVEPSAQPVKPKPLGA